MKNPFSREGEQHDKDPVRPRFGWLTRDGEQRLIVFHPSDEPNTFIPRYADTEEHVIIRPTDHFTIDVLAPGQSVAVMTEEL